jgi:hypothetical protein
MSRAHPLQVQVLDLSIEPSPSDATEGAAECVYSSDTRCTTLGIFPILVQQVIEQDHISGKLLNFRFTRGIRTLRTRHEQTKHKRSKRAHDAQA